MDKRKNWTGHKELIRMGSLIKGRRQELKLSQRDLAEISGVSQATISHVESADYNPTYMTIAQLSKAMGRQINLTRK